MHEDYLQFLWQNKKVIPNQLFLVDGRELIIEDVGWLNSFSGPDFFNGSVIIDGIKWSGNIEIHINSSDWYNHKHHLDRSYDNVVLHVVLKHDKEVNVQGRTLPTLELQNHIDYNHYESYLKLHRSLGEIPCHKSISSVSNEVFQKQLDISFFQRLQNKALDLFGNDKSNHPKEILFAALIQAIGGKVNKHPFQELSKRLNFRMIEQIKWNQNLLEALFFGISGFLSLPIEDAYQKQLHKDWQFLKHKYNLSEMQVSTWKFGGVRPPNFPSFRIAQLAVLVKNWNFLISEDSSSDMVLENLKQSLQLPDKHIYWSYHYSFGKISKQHLFKLSKPTKELLIINGILPYLVYLHQTTEKMGYLDLVEELAEILTAEKNAITRKFSSHGVKFSNAKSTQGALELYDSLCKNKSCLKCEIGGYLLG